MRSSLRAFVLTPVIFCAAAALAADKAVVTVPFNFETHGQTFPAGKYTVTLDMNETIMTLRNVANPSESLAWTASPADPSPKTALSIRFDNAGNTHALHSVQLGARTTSVLDAPALSHDAGSDVAAVSGQ